MELVNPDSEHKPRRSTIGNLRELEQAMDSVSEKGTWSEIVGSITSIRTSSKPFYLSCPHCKKKVAEATNECNKCGKEYEEPQPRYIMQLSISDHFDGKWVNAYDQVGSVILGMKAPEYAKLTQEEVQELVKNLKFKEFKFKMINMHSHTVFV